MNRKPWTTLIRIALILILGAGTSIPTPAGASIPAAPEIVTAVDDFAETDEDIPVDVDVLANDSDHGGQLDPTSVTVVVPALVGSTSVDPQTGVVTYTPDPNIYGSDSFQYQVCNIQLLCDSATVYVTIISVNDPPFAQDDFVTIYDENTTIIDILANDFDIDGFLIPDSVEIVVEPTYGIVTFINPDTGAITYEPDPEVSGLDIFSYQVCDNDDACSQANVIVHRDLGVDPPVANDDLAETLEDTPVEIDILANDSGYNPEYPNLTIAFLPAHGSIAINIPQYTLTYTPNPNYYGSDWLIYRICNIYEQCNTARVDITIIPVNDPPVANDDIYTTLEDTLLVVPVESGVLNNDFDIENDPLSAVLWSDVTSGTLELEEDGSFTYLPAQDYYGVATFTYRAFDGEDYSNIATVTINILPVNDPPVAVDDTYNMLLNTVLNVPAPGVLANDYDVEDDPLSADLVSDVPSGMLNLNSDGSFTYTPEMDFTGAVSFTYRAFDGEDFSNIATVTINVVIGNLPPVAVDDAYEMLEDTTLTVPAPGVLLNDFDENDDPLQAVLLTSPPTGVLSFNPDGSFIYTPVPDFFGEVTFSYRAFDGEDYSAPATVRITVENVNDPPVAVDDSYNVLEDEVLVVPPPGVLANDIDVDGDVLTAMLVTGPLNGQLSLDPNGSFIYTPNLDYFGGDAFTYRASDGEYTSNLATVTIIVEPVNDPPVANDDVYYMSTFTVPVGFRLEITAQQGVLANDYDVDGDPLVASMYTIPPVDHIVNLSPNGAFTYDRPANFEGLVTFTYQVSDGEATALADVNIYVDYTPPTAEWLLPVEDNGFYTIPIYQKTIELRLTTSDSTSGVDRIEYIRWDPDEVRWVEMGLNSVAPYMLMIDVASLRFGPNEVRALVYDMAGNRTTVDHIWLIRSSLVFLPLVIR
jgi:large repetitive protein